MSLKEGRTEREWRSLWQNDIWSSDNFQRLPVGEKGYYLLLWSKCRDGKYAGKFCEPNGRPLSLIEIISALLPRRGDRTDRIKEGIAHLMDNGMLYLINLSQEQIPASDPINQEWLTGKHPELTLVVRKYAEKTGQFMEEVVTRLSRGCHEVGTKLSRGCHEVVTKLSRGCQEVGNAPLVNQGVIDSQNPLNPLKRGDNKSKDNKNKKEDIHSSIFNHWNLAELLNHRKLSDKMKRAINGRITEGYTVKEIIGAITTYSLIVNDKTGKYWWTHKNWSLDMFLQRGFERFKDSELAFQSCLKNSQDREKFLRAKAINESERMVQTKPCPECKASGFNMKGEKKSTLIDDDAMKIMSAKAKEKLIQKDGKYYLETYPLCEKCRGMRRIKINNEAKVRV